MACYMRAALRDRFKISLTFYRQRVGEMMEIHRDAPLDWDAFQDALARTRIAFDEVWERKSALNTHRIDHGC